MLTFDNRCTAREHLDRLRWAYLIVRLWIVQAEHDRIGNNEQCVVVTPSSAIPVCMIVD